MQLGEYVLVPTVSQILYGIHALDLSGFDPSVFPERPSEGQIDTWRPPPSIAEFGSMSLCLACPVVFARPPSGRCPPVHPGLYCRFVVHAIKKIRPTFEGLEEQHGR